MRNKYHVPNNEIKRDCLPILYFLSLTRSGQDAHQIPRVANDLGGRRHTYYQKQVGDYLPLDMNLIVLVLLAQLGTTALP